MVKNQTSALTSILGLCGPHFDNLIPVEVNRKEENIAVESLINSQRDNSSSYLVVLLPFIHLNGFVIFIAVKLLTFYLL